MTDQQGPDAGHLGLEVIGDLDEGLLSPAAADAARQHLAGCARCQDDQAALSAVRQAMAGEREVPMPDDVAARVFGALGQLPPLTAEDLVPEPVRASVTTLPAPREPHRATKPILIALGAAAAVTLVALGVVNLPHTSGSTASSAAGTSAASTTAAVSHSGRNYTAAGLGSQGLALLPGAPAMASGAAAAATSGAAAATSAAAAASGAAAPAAPPGDKASDKASSAPAAPAAPTTDVLAPLEQGTAAQSCLMSFEPKSGPPLAVDFGTFAGKPAIVGVFQDPARSARLQVVAVGPGCSLYSFALIARP
jgi:hypothetical protein